MQMHNVTVPLGERGGGGSDLCTCTMQPVHGTQMLWRTCQDFLMAGAHKDKFTHPLLLNFSRPTT